MQLYRNDAFDGLAPAQPRPFRPRIPGPGIAKPERRQQVKLRGFGTAIDRLDPDQNVIRRALRIFYEDIEIAVLVEDAGVNKLEFQRVLSAPAILFHQPRVGELALRVLVQVFHVGVCRRRVQIKVVLFHILAVIALAAGEAEEAFFKDRIAAVPEGQGEADELVLV